MKFLNGQYYVKVKATVHLSHPTENIILRKRDPALSLRTQYQIQNETQIRKSHGGFEKNGKLEVKTYIKKNDQFNNNQNLNHLIVLIANKNFGGNLKRVTVAKILNIMLTNRNIG